MQYFLDTVAEIMTELLQYGTADENTVTIFLEMLNNHDAETGVVFEADPYGIVDWTEA